MFRLGSVLSSVLSGMLSGSLKPSFRNGLQFASIAGRDNSLAGEGWLLCSSLTDHAHAGGGTRQKKNELSQLRPFGRLGCNLVLLV